MVNMEQKLPWRRRVNKLLVQLAKYVVPYLYLAYFRFVWATSTVIDQSSRLDEALEEAPHRFVCAAWHQDVFWVPWVYRRPHIYTIASVGDAGEVIAHLLKFFNYTVFRGGSSKRVSRRKKILEEFTQHLMTVDKPAAGITVDGSSGPAYRMKGGVIVMAMKLGAPMYLSRAWCKRRILLRTWDRTSLPLPFNKIVVLTEGPYRLPEHLDQEAVFERFHRYIENQLLELTYKNFCMLDDPIDERLMAKFPDGWKPSSNDWHGI
jgi:lysophospholipid acyltransferase (LPLAT)-like uncharacterized protein